MNNELAIFNNEEFGQVRTILIDGKDYFCASDIAKALGYENPRKAVSDHCKGVTKRYAGVITGKKADGSDAIQQKEMNFIPESDIYRLIIRSKLPSAERFEAWIFEEVLPSIRKTGEYTRLDSYTIEDPVERALAWAEEQKQARLQLEMVETELEETKELIKLTRLQVNSISRAINDKVSSNLGKKVYAYNSHYVMAKADVCAYFNANILSEIRQDDYERVLVYIKDEI